MCRHSFLFIICQNTISMVDKILRIHRKYKTNVREIEYPSFYCTFAWSLNSARKYISQVKTETKTSTSSQDKCKGSDFQRCLYRDISEGNLVIPDPYVISSFSIWSISPKGKWQIQNWILTRREMYMLSTLLPLVRSLMWFLMKFKCLYNKNRLKRTSDSDRNGEKILIKT